MKKSHQTRYFLKLWCAISLLLLAPQIISARSAIEQPKPGMLLIATENLAGTSFEKTVILITQFSPQGATGIAINRPSEFKLTDVVPDASKHQAGQSPLYLGGPVHPSSVLFLTSHDAGHALIKITEGVYFGGGTNSVKDTLKRKQTKDNFRAFAGYAGWAPGQLNNEINRNDWTLKTADKNQLFLRDTSKIWLLLSQETAGNWI